MKLQWSRLILLFCFTIMAINLSMAQENAPQDSLTILSATPDMDALNIDPNTIQITVMFDRSVVPVNMLSQPASILSIEPAIEGDGQWVHPAVYEFTPAQDAIVGGREYRVSVDTSLQAVDGSTLNTPYTWSFQTIEPQVIEIIPTDILEGSMSTNNGFFVSGMLLDSDVQVSFTQPMDRASTEEAFALQKYIGPYCSDGCSNHPDDWSDIEGSFAWADDNRIMTFSPLDHLEYSDPFQGSYRAVLDTTAQNDAGFAVLSTPTTVGLYTVLRPAIISTSPAHREIIEPGVQRVTISFSGAMNTETYRNHYSISPTPPGEITPYVTDTGALQLEFEHEVDTDYTLTIYAGIEDIYGTPIENDISVTYQVREPQPETIGYMQLPEGQNFVIAPTYLDNPGIPWYVPQETDYTVSIYEATYDMLFEIERHDRSLSPPFSLHQFYQPQGYYYWEAYGEDPFTIPWLQDEFLVSQNSVTLTPSTEDGETLNLPLQNMADDPLPHGIYGVDINERAGFVLAIANAGITVVRSYNETLVWVTDYETSTPIPDVLVTVQNNNEMVTGVTNEDGLVRIEDELGNGLLMITAEAEGIFGVWQSGSGGSMSQATPIYLYTDRPIYRPGEPIHYRGIVRSGTNLQYDIPSDIETVYANLQSGNCAYAYGYCESITIYEGERPLSETGTFSDSFDLPDDLAPGNYQLQVSTCAPEQTCESQQGGSIQFQVAEFRVPEFTVELTPQFDEIISGEPINVDVSASYYFGGAVQDAQFTRTGRGWYTRFVYQGTETGYNFGSNGGNASIYAPEEYLTVQSDGHYLLTDTPQVSGSLPVRLTVEASILDITGQTISGNTSLIIHPANVYIGLRPSSRRTDINTPVDLDILSIFPDSTIRPNQSVTLEIVEHRSVREEVSFGNYRWHNETIPITTETFQTNTQGYTSYTFEAPNTGRFALTARTTDEEGRQAETVVWISIHGSDSEMSVDEFGDALVWVSCEFRQPLIRLRVISDQEQYIPGDTAIIHFQNPYAVAVSALITIERANIRHEEVVFIEPGLYRYDLPLTGDDAPNIFFSVVLLRPAMLQSSLQQYLQGSVVLNVENVERRLNVSVTPSAEEVAPGQSVSFDLLVTDFQGNPVSAEVGVALTDEAIFALANPRYTTMEDYFYPFQYDRVSLSSSGLGLLQNVPIDLSDICGHGGGGGTGLAPAVRDDFIITPLWNPHVMTDENGQASVSVTMPDNLTQWRFDARAVTTTTQVGQTQSMIVTTLPLITRSVAPRFFVAGDHLPLVAVVHNNTDAPMRVQVELVQQGLSLDDGVETLQIIELSPHSLQRVEWWGTVDDVDGVYMETRVISNTGLSDASIPTLTTGENNTIPVRDFTATDTVATSGILQDSGIATEQIDLRFEPYPQDGQLNLQIENNLADALLTSVENLTIEEDQSNWQNANMLWMYTSLLTTDLLELPTQIAFDSNVDVLLSRIIESQGIDGGWGWYANMGSSPYMTATVLISLEHARESGWDVDSETVQRGADYLNAFLITPSTNMSSDMLNTQAQYLYALAAHGQVDITTLDELYDYRLELSVAARAHLLLAYIALQPDSEQVATLSSDITSFAILSGNGAHWEEINVIQSNWMRNRTTSAIALYSLVKAQPSIPIVPDAIRWLMTAQSSTYGSTYTEMTWSIAAVAEWSRQIGATPADYDYSVVFNGASVFENTIPGEEADILFTFQDLIPAQFNTLTIERTTGDGILYYAAQLQVDYPADMVEAVERGVRIERQYINHATQEISETAQVGDIVMVNLTIYVMEDMYYVTLEDILPAGLEPLDWSLDTTTTQANRPTLYTYYHNNARWGWGLVYWSSQQIHDDGSRLRANILRRGVYSYTYPARATTPGTFLVPPTQIYAAEQPEIFGRTEAIQFTISAR